MGDDEATALDHTFEHRRVINAAPERVWTYLWDIELMASCIDGCQDVVIVVEGSEYQALLKKRFGPFSVKLDLRIAVSEARPPSHISIGIEGADRRLRSRVQQRLAITLDEDAGPGTCRLQIVGQVEIDGMLGSLGRHLIEMHTRQNIEDFTTALARAVERTDDPVASHHRRRAAHEEGTCRLSSCSVRGRSTR